MVSTTLAVLAHSIECTYSAGTGTRSGLRRTEPPGESGSVMPWVMNAPGSPAASQPAGTIPPAAAQRACDLTAPAGCGIRCRAWLVGTPCHFDGSLQASDRGWVGVVRDEGCSGCIDRYCHNLVDWAGTGPAPYNPATTRWGLRGSRVPSCSTSYKCSNTSGAQLILPGWHHD